MVFSLILLLSNCIFAGSPEFSIHKKNSGVKGPTILVVGGIQGDEPGGFNAASLLVTNYKITRGNVWVVPNLNFISIIKRSRGVYGDLNRKFASLKKTDPEYNVINKIKSLIQSKDVDIILNLHDGSGFYNPKYIDKQNNPRRWGHCLIVDQDQIKSKRFGDLTKIANSIVKDVNKKIKKPFFVHNTKTVEGDEEMAKSLTYFAINNLKPAFGVEASKSFLTHTRAFYHLLTIESFFRYAGIGFEKDFKLNLSGVKKAINSNIMIALNKRILLDMENARRHLRYIPLKKNSKIEFQANNPLVAVTGYGKNYRVSHGNRRISYLLPQYFEYDKSIDSMIIEADGVKKEVKFGGVISISNAFKVIPKKKYRVNIIGYKKYKVRNEAGILVQRKDIIKRYSVDRDGNKFRVEVYRNKMFSGMILIDFTEKLVAEDKKRVGSEKT
jgi:hypothetical protein